MSRAPVLLATLLLGSGGCAFSGAGRELSAPRPRPLVVAHRGFSWVAPENTLAAYRLAMEAGAALAECDVFLSKDRVPVLMHDETLERTTDGSGRVEERSLAELRRLDAGSWKSAEFRGEPVPTLQETLELVRGRMRLVIEIKGQGMEQEVLQAMRAAGVAPQDVMAFAFEHETVRRMGEIEPRVPTTWLIDELTRDEEGRRAVIRRALEARVSALGAAGDRVDEAFLRLAHESGFQVFVWTVNDVGKMEALVRAGADAIITDRPDVALELFAR